MFTRRRVLALTAAVGALVAVRGLAAHAAPEPQVWRGTALGAEASITLHHPDPAVARMLIGQCLDEIRRLEALFSLYQSDSVLSRLNAEGLLEIPPLDVLHLLTVANRFSELTNGAFDVTVQPLWRLYADHFASLGTAAEGPSEQDVARIRALVGYRALQIDSRRVTFKHAGMGVTLNGIAQGYITDRVAELLRRAGLDHVLIDLGEIRTLGDHPDGRPWRVAIKDPRDPSKCVTELPLNNWALATSAGAGTRFDRSGRFHHLFDPRSGHSTARYASVSVMAPSATTADALSTAFSSMTIADAERVCDELPGVKALFLLPDRTLRSLGAWA